MTLGKIGIINYGVGNLQSIRNAVRAGSGLELDMITGPEELMNFDKIILPGVGAFGVAIGVLRETSLDQGIKEFVKSGRPLLGICLGMQLLASRSYEHGEHEGLDIIPGTVNPIAGEGIRSIHMGWNDIHLKCEDPLLKGVPSGTDFYFVHGYSLTVKQPECILAECDYGGSVVSIARHENAWGVQFHPEKSQQQGIRILANFARI